MKITLKSLMVGIAVIVAAPSAIAEDQTPFVELEVGRTRILCYTEPCPWNGIAGADSPVWPVTLLWAGAEPPPMRGSTEDRIFILENYAENCTLVSGRYEGGILEIGEILGSC
jgi:hypothetical protein